MVKLIYDGLMANGMLTGKGTNMAVVKGETYDIPEKLVKELLNNGEWKKVGVVKIEEKKKLFEEDD